MPWSIYLAIIRFIIILYFQTPRASQEGSQWQIWVPALRPCLRWSNQTNIPNAATSIDLYRLFFILLDLLPVLSPVLPNIVFPFHCYCTIHVDMCRKLYPPKPKCYIFNWKHCSAFVYRNIFPAEFNRLNWQSLSSLGHPCLPTLPFQIRWSHEQINFCQTAMSKGGKLPLRNPFPGHTKNPR